FIAWFAISFLYPLLFEALWNGATPGKRICGLAVVHGDGTPIGWSAALVRNVMRIADMLPVGYAAGLTSMLLDGQFRRLGEFAAAHAGEWHALAGALAKRGADAVLPAREVPRRFRSLVSQLALARDRQYRTSLIDRLHALVLEAHLAVHAARAERRYRSARALWQWIAADFPAHVRAQ